jgi:(p)ppGpp synthase/HD superfamily hydrolase
MMIDSQGSSDIPAIAPRFERAMRLAIRGHYFQFRKRNGNVTCSALEQPLPEACVPYVAHLMGVVTILAGLGADDRILAAAVLHDYLEDVPDPQGAETILAATDDETLALVQELTEDKRDHVAQDRTWELRKQEQLEAMGSMTPDAVLIKAADLLHNVTSLIHDLRQATDREQVWDRFNAGRDRQLWYFDQVRVIASDRLGPDHRLSCSLSASVATVRALD